MKRFLFLLLLIYLASYAFMRLSWAETWDKDKQSYVIFPKEPIALYYAYRPLMIIDSKLTGQRFHIGPHQ